MTPSPRVVVIGPCASGKTTLVRLLTERGVTAAAVSQEHTCIPDLYRHGRPDVLVYLEVSYEEAARRREISWGPERLEEQVRFMAPARAAADLVVATDGRSAREVADLVQRYLATAAGATPADPAGAPSASSAD